MADPLDDLPPELAALIRRLSSLIDGATEPLIEAITPQNVEQWQTVMEELLMRYHTAAWLKGRNREAVDDGGKASIVALVTRQVEYLQGFADAILEAGEWQGGFSARARSYALATKVAYWEGKTFGLPLPAQPAQGTTCMGQCGCSWVIKWIDRKNKDVDAVWTLGKSDSCQVCLQRASEWNPVRIRGGVLQLG